MTKKTKAIALISGGLDSLLAAHVIMDQGIEVKGIVFILQFASKNMDAYKKQVREASEEAGIVIDFFDISEPFLEVLKSPCHGFGANLNPCIDCKILMLRYAKNIMARENAKFIITGEVLGERPMSQRRGALETIERDSAVAGCLLRPLSAKLLEETVLEKEGIVDREKLLDIQGRSRERQLKMAKHYGLTKYFAPGGGCLLTEKLFSRKIKDLMDAQVLSMENVELLKYGRHFRLDKETKAIVGRDKKENAVLIALKGKQDILLRMKNTPGPCSLLIGKGKEQNIRTTAALVISHSKYKEKNTCIEYWQRGKGRKILTVDPLSQKEIEKLRI
ncbi:MAG: tRNA 4-thiouridine(8) synthase ThiI [Candidatus Omnitrophota bacterium]